MREYPKYIIVSCALCLLLLACFVDLGYAAAGTISPGTRVCPCQDARLCQPIPKSSRKEVYGFSTMSDWEIYSNYDWTKLTTLTMWEASWTDEIICFAHGKGVRLDLAVEYPPNQLTNASYRTEWIAKTMDIVKNKFLDGINFDIEYPIRLDEVARRQGLLALVNETKTALTKILPGSMLSFDVTWASSCVAGGCYDYKGLADIVDFLFIMAYDVQGQIWGPDCIAMSNSPLLRVIDGVRGYLSLGIPASKLVLGLPWYGYVYNCISLSEKGVCELEKVGRHGALCSGSAVGSLEGVDDILHLLDKSTDGRVWNLDGEAPMFTYKNATGHTHQVHYDDPESLLLRYRYAVSENMRGVGFWHIGCMTNMDTPARIAFRKQMWDLIPDTDSWDSYILTNKPAGKRF